MVNDDDRDSIIFLWLF